MLTLNTQIPTACRGAVRSLVKAHKDWQAFITAKGKLSAAALNADLIEFALKYPVLVQQIESILSLGNLDVDGHVVVNEGETFADVAEQMQEAFDSVPVLGGATGKAWEGQNAANAAFDAYELDKVLSSVDQFLAPLVRSELGKALAPVIAAANKPAVEVERVVEVEVERVVEVAPGEARKAVAPKAKRDKRVPFRSLFPTKAKDAYLDGLVTLWAGVKAPEIDPFYVVDREQMATLMTAFERGTNCWLTGPAGTGKSTMPMQAAAALGRPFVRIGFTRQTDVESLVGAPGLHNGATVWEDGVLVKAMKAPGTVILIDEITLAPPGVQAIIQQVADDHRFLTLPTGEVVKCADGVVFVTADNTAGSGDEGGLYAGTNVSNSALVTRFKRMIFVDYLSAQKEAEALANHTGCPVAAARQLADMVAQARRMPTLAGVLISMRQMVGFVQAIQDGFSVKSSFEMAISNRMPATERATIEGLIDLTWQAGFEALVHGTTPAPVIQPSNSPASKAFGDVSY